MKIAGHREQQKTLCLLAETGSIPHAFLFSGPEAVGKKTLARWFLRLANCLAEKNRPCEECSSCREIREDTHTDVLEIIPVKKQIEVEQIKLVRERVGYRGLKANYKGIIIDDAHFMNPHAQNGLLKTLEEPTENTMIFLITEYPHALLKTVLSRCFHLRFSFVAEKDISAIIEDEELARLATGRAGKAVLYRDDKKARQKAEKIKEQAERMAKGEAYWVLQDLKKIIKEEDKEQIDGLIGYLLKALQREVQEGMREGRDVSLLCEKIKKIEKASYDKNKTNANVELALGNALV